MRTAYSRILFKEKRIKFKGFAYKNAFKILSPASVFFRLRTVVQLQCSVEYLRTGFLYL